MWHEWNNDGALPWAFVDEPPHAGMRRLVRDLNRVYAEQPALHQVDYEPAGFQWIDCNDNENSVISLVRRGRDRHDAVVAVFNFTPVVAPRLSDGRARAGRSTAS